MAKRVTAEYLERLAWESGGEITFDYELGLAFLRVGRVEYVAQLEDPS